MAVSGQPYSLRQKLSDIRIQTCCPSFLGRLGYTHKDINKHLLYWATFTVVLLYAGTTEEVEALL